MSRSMADINVTPLVDVMLVLLIVFMVAAPLMASGCRSIFPKSRRNRLTTKSRRSSSASTPMAGSSSTRSSVDSDRVLVRTNENSENDKERRIDVRGDKNIAYGKVMEAMGVINSAGYAKVALVSETPAAKAR